MTDKYELLRMRRVDEMIAILKSIDNRLHRIEHDMATEWLRAVNGADYHQFMSEEADNAADRLSGLRPQQSGNGEGKS